ncbi:hypothetical protein [Myroides injenensis]|uniref:hypothetical protein n=1 Tax=Myroides injenensis TaxID=1183151 RepID=UPI0002885CF1|nr:hypothetical protein [Myroides injenensis]
MDKEAYIKNTIELIKSKNLEVPFMIAPGSTVTDLDAYLNSLTSAYLANKDPRLLKLFQDKLEQLKNL